MSGNKMRYGGLALVWGQQGWYCYGYQVFLIIFSHFPFSIYLQLGLLFVMLSNIPI
jgi:hypothetical protein